MLFGMKKAAIGIVFSPDGKKILTVLRRDIPIWVLPGGGIEDNETPEAAIEREVFEETGVRVKVKRKVGIYFPLNRLASETFVFECEAEEQLPEIFKPQLETKQVALFAIDKLPKTFFFLHKEWLYDALHSQNPVLKPISSITWKKALLLFLQHPFYCLRYIFSRVVKINNL